MLYILLDVRMSRPTHVDTMNHTEEVEDHNTCQFNRLPPELLLRTFECLVVADLVAMRRVSKQLRDFVDAHQTTFARGIMTRERSRLQAQNHRLDFTGLRADEALRNHVACYGLPRLPMPWTHYPHYSDQLATRYCYSNPTTKPLHETSILFEAMLVLNDRVQNLDWYLAFASAPLHVLDYALWRIALAAVTRPASLVTELAAFPTDVFPSLAPEEVRRTFASICHTPIGQALHGPMTEPCDESHAVFAGSAALGYAFDLPEILSIAETCHPCYGLRGGRSWKIIEQLVLAGRLDVEWTETLRRKLSSDVPGFCYEMAAWNCLGWVLISGAVEGLHKAALMEGIFLY